jgi:hypothetical protein
MGTAHSGALLAVIAGHRRQYDAGFRRAVASP